MNEEQCDDLEMGPEFSKDWFLRLVKGMFVGIGGILPGLSGGVLAVIFGIYDKMLRFLGNLTDRFWQNVRYFIPVGIGFVLGILLFSLWLRLLVLMKPSSPVYLLDLWLELFLLYTNKQGNMEVF